MSASAFAGSNPSAIAAALADGSRPAADVQADHDRRPADLLEFAGIKSGDKVADLIPGGGYFTRLFRDLVGPQGHVYAVVPASVAAAAPQKLDPIKQLIDGEGDRNVSLVVRPYDDLGVDASLDVVWTSQNYHDVYGEVGAYAVAGLSGANATAKLDAAAFKALKPGGVYIVVDHAAKAGDGGKDAKTLHRIEAATVIEQAKAAGFVLDSRSDVLANREDDHSKPVFAAEIKGHTDKFVLKFRKPKMYTFPPTKHPEQY